MKPFTLGVIGIDHRHIFGQLEKMQAHGCACKGWWTEGEPEPAGGFLKRFADVPRVEDRNILLNDPEIDMILIMKCPSCGSSMRFSPEKSSLVCDSCHTEKTVEERAPAAQGYCGFYHPITGWHLHHSGALPRWALSDRWQGRRRDR